MTGQERGWLIRVWLYSFWLSLVGRSGQPAYRDRARLLWHHVSRNVFLYDPRRWQMTIDTRKRRLRVLTIARVSRG